MKCNICFGTALLLGIASFGLTARAVQPIASASVPTTQPTADVASLIQQLGDDDFHIRLGAERKLKAMGQSVVPAVEQARRSPDPEVHARAEEILQEIQHPLVAAGPVPQASGFGNQMMRVSVVNGAKTIDIQEPGRTIHIVDDSNGNIAMKVTGQLDGRQVTRDYKAKSTEQLKRENPSAFALFQQYAAHGSERQFAFQGNLIRVRAANVGGNGMGIIPGPAGVNKIVVQQQILAQLPRLNPNGDNLDRLEQTTVDQMKARNLPGEQQEEVKGLLQQLRQGVPANDANRDAQLRDYDRRCDALRQKLADLHLPDPGDALPPPATGRLGITVGQSNAQGAGLVITHILPNSRAEKLGLKDQDIIQKVNGKDVRTAQDLRKIVTENPKGLVVEGTRDELPFIRQERAEAPIAK